MTRLPIALALIIVATATADGPLQWVSSDVPPMVFADRPQEVAVTIRNSSNRKEEVLLRTRVFQQSAGTVMPVGDAAPWKTLAILPGQTVLERVRLTFPAVKTATMFEIHWLDPKGKALGRTSVQVYPDDLLKQLATLTEKKPIGLVDPDSQLKPLLKRVEIEFEDLEAGTALEKFDGPLIVVFTRGPKQPQTPHLSERIITRMKEGIAVIWIESDPPPRRALPPLAYPLREGRGVMFFAHASTVADLANSPQSQLNLIRFAEIALLPGTLPLPETP